MQEPKAPAQIMLTHLIKIPYLLSLEGAHNISARGGGEVIPHHLTLAEYLAALGADLPLNDCPPISLMGRVGVVLHSL